MRREALGRELAKLERGGVNVVPIEGTADRAFLTIIWICELTGCNVRRTLYCCLRTAAE